MAFAQFSRAWRDRVDESIAADSDHAAGLFRAIRRLNDPAASARALDDVVSEPWGRRRRDWYDAAAQFEVALELQAGFCVIAYVDLGALPGLDRDEHENQEKLGGLASPFTAWCAGGTGDDDGRLELDQPVQVEHEMQDDERLVVLYPPSGVPLEIGHTEPETTIFHLRRDGGVARWPYGHDRITLLLSTRVTGRRVQLETPDTVIGAQTLETRTRTLQELLALEGL